MKKAIRILLTLILAAGMIFGDLAAVMADPVTAGSIRTETLAKSRKKKNSSTPTIRVDQTAAVTPAEEVPKMTPTPVPDGPIIDPQSIADYLFAHGKLPDNFITKKEARALGWDSGIDLSKVAPGKSIGGDYFGNYEGKLPVGKGISYHEADCWYTGGRRNAYRVIYSSNGRVWYTEDHYNTFTELFPTIP